MSPLRVGVSQNLKGLHGYKIGSPKPLLMGQHRDLNILGMAIGICYARKILGLHRIRELSTALAQLYIYTCMHRKE